MQQHAQRVQRRLPQLRIPAGRKVRMDESPKTEADRKAKILTSQKKSVLHLPTTSINPTHCSVLCLIHLKTRRRADLWTVSCGQGKDRKSMSLSSEAQWGTLTFSGCNGLWESPAWPGSLKMEEEVLHLSVELQVLGLVGVH